MSSCVLQSLAVFSPNEILYFQILGLVDSSIEGRQTRKQVEDSLTHYIADLICHSQKAVDYLYELEQKADLMIESTKVSATYFNNIFNSDNQYNNIFFFKAKKTKAALAKHAEENVDESKFSNYFSFSHPVSSVKPHQILALNRGERLKVLSVKITTPDWIKRRFDEFCDREWISLNRESKERRGLLMEAVAEGWKKFREYFQLPSLETLRMCV